MTFLVAHGIGGIKDLPVPTWLFFWAAALVLFVSFIALGVLWRRPVLEREDWGRPLPEWLQTVLRSSALRIVLGTLAFSLLVLVTVAAFVGDTSPSRNLTPTFVYVVFWLGLVPVVILLGDVWPALNPWKAAADALSWVVDRLGLQTGSGAEYPARLGRWPAAFFLFLYAALELAYWNPAAPRALGLAIVIYSAVTWMGAAVFGRDAWFPNGEAFTGYFGFLARMAPFAVREREGHREVIVRPPLVGLAVRHFGPGSIAFVAVMLGSVAFDGFSRTVWWQDRRASLAAVSVDHFALTGTLLNVAGLVLAIAAVALAYLAAVELSRRRSGAEGSHADLYLGSLIPIAAAYAVSHYFSALLVQGQSAITLGSDPLGRGWDLFGTVDFQPNIAPLSPNTIWYVQVAALVGGHVLGLALAHDRALSVARTPERAVRGQLPLLALMVLYTVAGLWLLSQN
ncbi:MAG TPA: hypothetical protein VK285_02350 [Gaiellaceae bacterium]|nr:hypothetical protein [Gaiellaceae bacterium]